MWTNAVMSMKNALKEEGIIRKQLRMKTTLRTMTRRRTATVNIPYDNWYIVPFLIVSLVGVEETKELGDEELTTIVEKQYSFVNDLTALLQIPPSYHPGRFSNSHSSYFRVTKRWECCGSSDKSDPGCHSGEPKCHPGTWDGTSWNGCCFNKQRSSDGCTTRPTN